MKPSPLPSARDKMIWVVLMLWFLLVFGHYFTFPAALDFSFVSTIGKDFVQGEFSRFASNWLDFLKNFSCALTVLFVLWRLGRWLLHWIRLEETNIALRLCQEMSLGMISLNFLWLGLGLNGLWLDPLFNGLALVLVGWALWDWTKSFLKIQKFPRVSIPGKFFILVGFLGILGLGLDLFQGMVPDVYFDALVYHLSTLQFWKFHHGIADFYTNLYSYYPFGGELYFLNGFLFGGGEAAKILNAFAAGLAALAAAGWVAEESHVEQVWLTWTMILVLPLVSASVWTTQNDVLLALFLLLFFYALARWARGPGEESWALMAGLWGGAALTVKYTAVVGLFAGLMVLVFRFKKETFLRKKARGWLLIFVPMLLSLAPWLVKNFCFTGNGFYPYFSSLFGGRVLPAENMKALMGDHEAVLSGGFSPVGWIVQALVKDLDKTIAPLLFGFIPFLFFPSQRKPVTQFLLISSLLYLMLGFLVTHQLRLMVPAFLLSLTALGMALGEIKEKAASYAWGGVVIIFGLLSLLSLCRLSVDYYQTQKMALGEETREEYLAQSAMTSSYYGLTRAADTLLRPDDRLLVVGDARSLYYPRPFLAGSVFDEQVLPQLARQRKDWEGIGKGLREMGVDALAISGEEAKRLNQYPFCRLPPEDEKKLGDFFQHCRPLWGGPNRLLLLKAPPLGTSGL